MTPLAAAEAALEVVLAPLAGLLADPGVSELMVNAPDQVWIEQRGSLVRTTARLPAAALRAAIRLFASLSATDTLDRDAILEGQWQDWRVTAVLPPVARDSACLALRRHHAHALPLEVWRPGRAAIAAPAGACTDLSACLRALVDGRLNVLVSGSTGAGKTTLLASLLGRVTDAERVVCLEDSPELPLACAHQLRLLTRSGHTLRSLLRLGLRLRPDRLVLGEVRGPEAFDLLQAMATGHAGCLGTIHAPDARGALARLEQLVLTAGLDWPPESVRAQIAQCLGALIHVNRTPDGRRISELRRVCGFERGMIVLSGCLLELHDVDAGEDERLP